MKQLITFLFTFALAYAATLLFEIDFIAKNNIRFGLTVLLIVCIILAGASIIKNMNQKM